MATSLKQQGAVDCSVAVAGEKLPDIARGLFGELHRLSGCGTVEQIVAMSR